MAYQYTNAKGQTYYLHTKNVRLRSGWQQQIYYFAKKIKPEAIDQIPEGFEVAENKKTGLPALRRK
ncbi:MAG: hypothetical protein M1142_06175 [Patescibacteria group bacterium]|nr:hypothetical protein [Patescibacteria group bacterium]